MAQTIWITRHGSRLDFIDLNWFSQAERPYDPPLAPEGEVQAQQLGSRLKSTQIKHIFTSPFLRTVQTAHIIADILALPLKLEAGLSEWLNPDWMTTTPETLPIDILAQTYPRIDLSYKFLVIPEYPETETVMQSRVTATAIELVEQFPEDLLIVGHGASVVGTAKALAPSSSEINASFCSLVQLVRSNQGWQMILNGDTSHLSLVEQQVRFN
ncbi:histidine phosphatase family protein [Gloeocapsa sp. PCC 73106]|uniref:histidine phosphatase family protein n=1 Tax=Gloeocapsa sp. PCC 73106 TaxID=102232 RepID=UPI0002ABB5BF|nr:histidine phosphatase family protein [Gloeocapsa sp. PCC 73106]ELR99238.1 fructose-2,6-bisphosphatase [Gloeocapsa sp. PCC 73106]